MNASAVQILSARQIRLALARNTDVGDAPRCHDFVTRMDLPPMKDNDGVIAASAFGILRCLRALAQEASSLQMLRTLSAIEDALEAAARESGVECVEESMQATATSHTLH